MTKRGFCGDIQIRFFNFLLLDILLSQVNSTFVKLLL